MDCCRCYRVSLRFSGFVCANWKSAAAEADAGVKTEQVETNKQTDQNVVAAEGDANKANGAVADQAQQKQVKQPTQGEDEMIKLIKIHQINR